MAKFVLKTWQVLPIIDVLRSAASMVNHRLTTVNATKN